MNMQLPNFADASVGELFPHTFDLSGLPIGRGRSVMVVELTGAGFLQCLLVVADNDLESPSTEGLRRFNDPDVPILVGFSVVNDALATLVFRDDTGWTTQQPINLRQDIDDIADIAAHSSELAIRTITVSLATSRVLAKRDLIMSPSAASLFCKSIVPYCIALDADSPPSPAVTEALQILNLAPLPEAGGYWFVCPDDGQPPERQPDGFGVPLSIAELSDLWQTFNSHTPPYPWSLDEAYAALGARFQLARASGRWDEPHQVPRDPEQRYYPGDVVGLEATYAEAALISEIEIGVYPNLFSTNLGYAQLIHDARSYWLPAGSESVVLRSSPPPEVDICLPAPSCAVWFAQPVRVPPDMIPNTDMLIVDAIDHNRRMRRSDPGANAWREMLLPNGHVHRHMRQPGADYLDVSVMADLTNMRANLLHLSSYIEGVLLLADESSRPVPEFGWLVRHHKDWEGQVVSHRSIVPARSDRAAWGHLVRLLSGVIAFGEWVLAEQSEPMPPPNAPRRQRRRWERDIRRGVKRENERAGGLAQIHILRTQRPAQADGPADADVDRPQSTSGERASPIAHFRVGYFRRQHLGPRAEGRTEVRWIYPTVVNPENAPDEPRVYVLPRIE